jgi:hypothetical protein
VFRMAIYDTSLHQTQFTEPRGIQKCFKKLNSVLCFFEI